MWLEYPPGAAAPVHNHPEASSGFVVEGEVISQWEGGEIERYKAGESFVDHAERVHIRSENASKDKKLVFVVNYVIKVGEPNVTMLEK